MKKRSSKSFDSVPAKINHVPTTKAKPGAIVVRTESYPPGLLKEQDIERSGRVYKVKSDRDPEIRPRTYAEEYADANVSLSAIRDVLRSHEEQQNAFDFMKALDSRLSKLQKALFDRGVLSAGEGIQSEHFEKIAAVLLNEGHVTDQEAATKLGIDNAIDFLTLKSDFQEDQSRVAICNHWEIATSIAFEPIISVLETVNTEAVVIQPSTIIVENSVANSDNGVAKKVGVDASVPSLLTHDQLSKQTPESDFIDEKPVGNSNALQPDGPSEPRSWRHQGVLMADSMFTPGEFALVKFLWACPEKIADTRDVAKTVLELNPDKEDGFKEIENRRTEANGFFSELKLPWRVSITKGDGCYTVRIKTTRSIQCNSSADSGENMG